MRRGTLWLREAVSVQAIYVTWVFRAPAKLRILGVPAPRLVALHGVGLPAHVAQVLDAQRHRAHISPAPRAGLLRQGSAVLVNPVGIWFGHRWSTAAPASLRLRFLHGSSAALYFGLESPL